jgi:hypothetical protein
MGSVNPAQAINVMQRVEQLCDFIEHPAVRAALLQVPVTMPQRFGSLGFDPGVWVGLGLVGLWAALDAHSERAELTDIDKCPVCGSRCVPARFIKYCEGNEHLSLTELDDLRHLYAHNYVGAADDRYFDQEHPRHVLTPDGVTLTCGARFDGHRAQLDLPNLRYYSRTAQTVLGRLSRG